MRRNDQQQPEDIRNFIIFIVLTMSMYFAYDHFVLAPQKEALRQQQIAHQEAVKNNPELLKLEQSGPRNRSEVIEESKRISFENDFIFGSINTKGGRIDDLSLSQYHKTVEREENVALLSPADASYPRYVEHGWLSNNESLSLPKSGTQWRIAGNAALSKDNPVTLQWRSPEGLIFSKTYEIDENYGFTVSQNVENRTGKSVTIFPYALVREHGLPEEYFDRFIIHEGPIGYIDGKLHNDHSYKKIKKEETAQFTGTTGWAGITEKYWMAALIPDQEEELAWRYSYKDAARADEDGLYQVDILGQKRELAPGDSTNFNTRIFAGAKKVRTLESYEEKWNIRHFDLAVDFGMFYFLTRPFFYMINMFYGLVGNFGIAIIMFTIVLRIAVFPLANKSFKSFAELRKLAPEMTRLREEYGDDKQKLQEQLVKLYQEKKVNPMAGCLPILIQIPIFFALFKVLSNTIEMRHQPFFGWIQDLSAQDPTSVFNLFGLLPFTPPEFLMIGAWPCLMLVSMIVQKQLNPPPQDKTQAMMFNLMPYVMAFVLAKFAAGLVIYWTFNNIFSTIQQYIIMKRHGAEIHLFSFLDKNKDQKKLEEAIEKGPSVNPELEMVENQVEDALSGSSDEDKPVTKPKPRPKRKKKS